ncbi:hypothetical protein IT6_04815 [Methylacidiphilum caldifontis]|uniref:hypothetical protein n=1 Tax=Methylacidiphilum caldifontis TaxID=2795386 RepID=UPI001A8EB62B|nr:hypothetical protein [Methylacidiphilum caldifontis]QSR89592.1 hypothetical protein IT6_04815 [Methylacidiphilum caldifontis]
MKKVGSCLVALALIWIGGGQLFILQSIAWTRMFNDYSRSLPWYKAIGKTLGGKESCQLCKKIPRSFDGPPLKNWPQLTDKDLMLVLFASGFSSHFLGLDSFVAYLEFSFSCPSGEPPPTPPPKAIAVYRAC